MDFGFDPSEMNNITQAIAAYQQSLLTQISDLSVFWEAFHTNLMNGTLEYDRDYRVMPVEDSDEYTVAILYNVVYEKYLQYCKNNDLPHTDKNTLKQLLTSPANKFYVRQQRRKTKTVYFPRLNKSLSAYLFRTRNLRISGIDFSVFDEMVSEMPY